ncbi:hypothetical protein SAMN04489726_2603 [Allokutzneria albata]|uniref:Uncharacterized protein n=2 Tax=Allokutzneria albata TaxID=211114 RepID=A0A1G9USZ3_ALLAB|nr:hypothetical protein SAMN04489726_2603 [Allokutzneria albata]
MCAYSASGVRHSVGVGIRDGRNIGVVTEPGARTAEVNGRKAVSVPTTPWSCLLMLALGETARVEVIVIGDGNENACETARKLGDVVEPRLPKRVG